MFLALKSGINYVRLYPLPAPHFLHSSFPNSPSSFFPFLLVLGIKPRPLLKLNPPPPLIYSALLFPWPGDLVFGNSHQLGDCISSSPSGNSVFMTQSLTFFKGLCVQQALFVCSNSLGPLITEISSLLYKHCPSHFVIFIQNIKK